jgi:Domain of unknown function (DUF1844)
MSSGEPEDVFKVTDRRRRLDSDEPVQPSAAAPSPQPPGAPATSAPTSGSDGERSLAGLFMMLASSAVVALGQAPDPLTGQRQMDLAQAADAIDLLLLLRQKTEGNRSTEESRILDELLYDLQLRYVHATKRP